MLAPAFHAASTAEGAEGPLEDEHVQEARRNEPAHESGAPYYDTDEAAPPALPRPIATSPRHGATPHLRDPPDLINFECFNFDSCRIAVNYVKFSQPLCNSDHNGSVIYFLVLSPSSQALQKIQQGAFCLQPSKKEE